MNLDFPEYPQHLGYLTILSSGDVQNQVSGFEYLAPIMLCSAAATNDSLKRYPRHVYSQSSLKEFLLLPGCFKCLLYLLELTQPQDTLSPLHELIETIYRSQLFL